ncbi:MAG: DNA repair protein RecN [Bacteroidales bacterium]
MIKSLYIRNFALIDSLEIDFDKGFTTITGETGAGKSIILGALSLILGQRADSKALKDSESKSVIEGHFDLSAYALEPFFTENEIEYDAEHCILRRELFPGGKSRAFVNDTPVNLNQLKELASQLIDIHSQHQNLLLSDATYQLRVLDTLAGTLPDLDLYLIEFKKYRKLNRELKQLKEDVSRNRQEEDYLRFQFEQLDSAQLQDGEQELLEAELDQLNHAEEIKGGLYKIYQLIQSDENGLIIPLKEAVHTASALQRVYPKIKDLLERLESNLIDLKDIAAEAEDSADSVEFNPERLQWIQNRLDVIYTLQQKHNAQSVSELIALYAQLDERLQQMDNSDEAVLQFEKALLDQKAKVVEIATRLSGKRRKEAVKVASQLENRLIHLGMPNVKVELSFKTTDEPAENGFESVTFLFSANKNMPLQPIADIASGGEISRVMLSLKAMVAGATALPTIIFDEIDTGVSGEIADKMGDIMVELSRYLQVMSITHLPQIAAKGNAQFKVYKTDTEEATTTHLRRLEEEERIDEIARMLSGAVIVESALTHAREMLKKQ